MPQSSRDAPRLTIQESSRPAQGSPLHGELRPSTSTRSGQSSSQRRGHRKFSVEDDEQEVVAAAAAGGASQLRFATPDLAETDEFSGANGDESNGDNGSDDEFTLRDRQDAINTVHPFGIRIWKPALYKKRRGVEQDAEEDIHSTPNRAVPWQVHLGNCIWALTFGLLLSAATVVAALPLAVMSVYSRTAGRYVLLLRQLAGYFLWPFGKYIQLVHTQNYWEEDDGHGRPVADYLAWQQQQQGTQTTSRLFFAPRPRRPSMPTSEQPRRLFGRGQWTAGRVVFYAMFYTLLAPMSMAVAALCWLGVIGVPMARVLFYLMQHVRIHPLALTIKPTAKFTDEEAQNREQYSIVLCTYRAFGIKYYKYTVEGTNVILLNMMAAVFVTVADFTFFKLMPEWLRFTMSLVSTVPLAHFIGQAVASISAQSSMSMGATINAFFSTVVEVYLYLVALKQGKGELVEGSITGSVLAGILVMPGLSMCAGALKRKTQRFNPRSQGATSTMLMFSLVGVLAPTIFYTLYGPTEIVCDASCQSSSETCSCWSNMVQLTYESHAYRAIVQPFSILCAVSLFVAYAVGLLFTLRTHAALIWAQAADEEDTEGHATPNWGRRKSYIILLTATWLYALIAEILVDSVDIVLEHIQISQRMLGISIFALVPNTTEFLNAISFAVQGNVALSLEIGSAYALQVCLLQIPALVLASLPTIPNIVGPLRDYAFVLVFPRWDMWATFICVILYTHIQAEGKSNYFKGLILLLAYLVLVVGFYFDDFVYEDEVPGKIAESVSSAALSSSLLRSQS